MYTNNNEVSVDNSSILRSLVPRFIFVYIALSQTAQIEKITFCVQEKALKLYERSQLTENQDIKNPGGNVLP